MSTDSPTPPTRSWSHVLLSVLLLVALLVGVGLLLALLGSLVSIPQGGVVVIGGVVLIAFIGLQVLVFRSLGLHSRADEAAAHRGGRIDPTNDDFDAEGDEAHDADWRSWRG